MAACGRYICENFPIGTYFSQNSVYSVANLWATIKILIFAPAVNQILSLVIWFM